MVASFLKQVYILPWGCEVKMSLFKDDILTLFFFPKHGQQWGFAVPFKDCCVTMENHSVCLLGQKFRWQCSDFWHNVLCFHDTRWMRMWLLHWSCQHQALMKNFCVKLKQFLSLWRTWHGLVASNKPDGQKLLAWFEKLVWWTYHCCWFSQLCTLASLTADWEFAMPYGYWWKGTIGRVGLLWLGPVVI